MWHSCARRDAGLLQNRFAPPNTAPQYPPDRPFALERCELYLRVDPVGRRVEGRATLTLRARRAAKHLVIDAADLQLQSVSVTGARLGHYESTDNGLELTLGHQVESESQLSVEIHYRAHPKRGLFFVGPAPHEPQRPVEMWTHGQPEDGRAWFPTLDTPFDKASTHVEITVPEKFFALSNGTLQDTRVEGRQKTYVYEQSRPHSPYLVTVVVGEYVAIEAQAGDIPIRSYVHAADKERGEHTFGRVQDMLLFFEKRFGTPYPYGEYSQICVADFVLGGMENTSATTLTERVLHGPAQGPDLTARTDSLIAHELSHQWFGNLVTATEWAEAWLHEGFATYAEILWCAESRGQAEADYERLVLFRRYAEQSYRRPLVERRYVHPLELFDRHLYEKGALVLHHLRTRVGDAAFFKALSRYLEQHADGSAASVDLQRALFDASGHALDQDFDQWVYGAGHPKLKLSGGWSAQDKAYVLQLEQQQDTPFSLEVRLEVVRNDRSEFQTWRVSDKQSVLHITGQRPDYVLFDPQGDLLAEVEDTRDTSELIRIAVEAPSVRAAIAAIEALAQKNSHEALATLESLALQHKQACVRLEAARALGEVMGNDAKDTLMAVTLEDGDVRVRRAALQALGAQRAFAEEVSEFLIRHADIERSDFALADTIAALGQLRADGATEFVLRSLKRNSFDHVVEAAAVAALGVLRETEHIELLQEKLQEQSPPRVRTAAATALGQLAGGLQKGHHGRQTAADALAVALFDPWYGVRGAAARSLARLDEPEAAQCLRALARREVDGRVLRAVREALNAPAPGLQSEELRSLRAELDRLSAGHRQLQARAAAEIIAPTPQSDAGAPRGRLARARALLDGRRS